MVLSKGYEPASCLPVILSVIFLFFFKEDKNLKSETPNSKFFPGAKAPSLGHCTNNTVLAYSAPGIP